MRERERESERESSVSSSVHLAVVLMFPHQHLPAPRFPPAGSQLSPGGSGAASSLSGGQEAEGPLHRQQVRST